MARYGVDARIIDRRNTKVFRGHADGLRAGTIELFDSMGFQHRLAYEGMEVGEWGFWVRSIPCCGTSTMTEKFTT
jgi:phenol 2-monooxygenase